MGGGQVLVAYGSQAGCAQSIAERLHESALKEGYDTVLSPLNDYYDKLGSLKNFAALIVVCSTTGNGDPPDNAERFYRKLKRRTNKPDMLDGARFAVLGLGDTNYSQFCRMGKALDKRFHELGAERYYNLGCADDAVGLDQVVEPWIEGLWSPLARAVLGEGAAAATAGAGPVAGNAAGAGADGKGGGEGASAHRRAEDEGAAGPTEEGPLATAGGGGQLGSREEPFPFATWESLPGCGEEGGVRSWEALVPEAQSVEEIKPLLTGRIMAPPAAEACTVSIETGIAHSDGGGGGGGAMEGVAGPGTAGALEVGVGAASEGPSGGVPDPLRSPGPAVPAPRGATKENRAERALQRAESTASRAARLEALRRPTTALEGPGYSAEEAVGVEVADAWYLTSGDSTDRRVVHAELRVGEFSARWSPGDSFGILCPNPDAVVRAVLSRLNLDGVRGAAVAVEGRPRAGSPAASLLARAGPRATVEDALRWHVDLVSMPRKKFLRLLADRCEEGRDKARLLLLTHRGGAAAHRAVVEEQRPTLAELLALFPSCRPTLADVLLHGSPPAPRFYSAASSPLADPQRVAVAFSVVEYRTVGGVRRLGVCTSWLERTLWPRLRGHRAGAAGAPPRQGTGMRVRVFLKPAREFAPPADPARPMVMIGPGTGVAPFRGFLEHRVWEEKIVREQRSEVCAGVWRGGWEVEGLEEDGEFARPPQPGRSVLFFGCRRRDQDYLYEEDMAQFRARGALSEVVTAFSREQARKVYVQHRMREAAAAQQLAHMVLRQDAHVYVCGDGARMAKDVHEALVEVLSAEGDLGADGARAKLKEMAARQRYVQDIWS